MSIEIKDRSGTVVGYAHDPQPGDCVKIDTTDDISDCTFRTIDHHTPPHFRYPSTTDELMEYGRDFFQRGLQIAEERNKRYALPTAPFRNFELCGPFGFATRISDKCSRLVTLTEPGCVFDDGGESVEDTLLDLANYCFLLSAYRANKRGNTQ